MADFYEIDFLDIESGKSGDAVLVRYEVGGETYIHVVDGGFQSTGDKIKSHIRTHYGHPVYIDHVVATHNDGDHAGGLRTVLEEYSVGALWMLRPWLYAAHLVDRFDGLTSADNLYHRLRRIYSNLAALEEIAIARGIPIHEPVQGAQIGAFTVLAPSRSRFLDLVVQSTKTPAPAVAENLFETAIRKAIAELTHYVLAPWGHEAFSNEPTSAENEMSVVQYANIHGCRILLTGDVGKAGLEEAADFATYVGIALPGVDRFQVPHHGSRRNLSTAILDRWLGPRRPRKPQPGEETFSAYIMACKADDKHPRRAVVRALIHRGALVLCTKEHNDVWAYRNAPFRGAYGSITSGLAYPADQEA